MKKLFILTLILLSASLFGQSNNNNTMALLKWLIKRDHIQYLNVKSNAAAFHDKNAFTKQTLITDSGKDVPNMSLKDFLSADELQICKTAPHLLDQTDWRKKYARLKTTFVTDKFPSNPAANYTVYSFSEPIFLNKERSRVIVGEYFICGLACGRDDLLLCELKNGRWQLIARAVIADD
jgi:hypothetical protein